MTKDTELKIEFAPGAFDTFEGTQEELEALQKEIIEMISGMTPEELSQAITLQDPARLMRVPGIGKKTAERLLLEMKGKLGADLGHTLSQNAAAGSSTQSDVMHALTALGYSERESLSAVKGLPEGMNISDAIRQALKGLSK